MVEAQYTPRFLGPRWTILYGSYTGIEQIAVNQLQKLVQKYLPYVIEVVPAFETYPGDSVENIILIGTPGNNPQIKELISRANFDLGQHKQGYLLACVDSPWRKGCRVLLISGSTSQGVLFAIQELGKYLAANVATKFLTSSEGRPDLRKAFDALPDFHIQDSPTIENRGIWTWGYVIRDYRQFFDNMACLRMNMAIIWNDIPPVNAPQVIEYAHQRGISVIFGFHWGWGLSKVRLANPEDRRKIKEFVLENYQQHYQSLELDGIYFQTLTEHSTTEQDGMTTAQAACLLVNDTSGALHAINPGLPIYFGLHATSIQDNFIDLASLAPHVTIVWEDAGGIPFAYDPVAPTGRSFGETMDYSRRIAAFRPDSRFAMVAKGWTTLRWEDEFEHHSNFILGEQQQGAIQQKLNERQPEWNRVNARWFSNFHFAAQFYRAMTSLAPSGMIVTGLVEDGGLEEEIQPSVALFAETIWDPNRPNETLLQAALNPYYQDH